MQTTKNADAEKRNRLPMTAVVAVWALLIALGQDWMMTYSFAVGEAGEAGALWPQTSPLTRSEDKPTLVMVAHPRCSCTRASISELSRLMTRLDGQVSAQVVFVKPDGFDKDWE